MKKLFKLFLPSIFFFPSVFAGENFDYYVTNSCKIDKNNSVKMQPENFNYSNNLISEIGLPMKAEGKIFILTGKIVDINCVPISDAKINIWQADSYGILNHNNSDKKNRKIQDFFQVTGTANSDNLGLFHFVTIIPNYFNKQDGEIFLKISLDEVGEFYRTIKINERMLKKSDLYLLYPDKKDIYSSIPQYKFIWTIEANNNFTHY